MSGETAPQQNALRSLLRSFLKVRLRTALLLMALFASWLALRVSLSERAQKTNQLKAAKELLGESLFENESQYGLAKEQSHYNYDWQVYLPIEQKHELCWALDNDESSEQALPTGKIELEPGLHRVRLVPSWGESRTYLVTLTVDGKSTEMGRFEASGSRHDFLHDIGTPKTYTGRITGLGGNKHISIYQQPTDQPLEIIRGRTKTLSSSAWRNSSFIQNGGDDKLSTDIRLWITSSKVAQPRIP